jgi:hypothetical protein
MALNPFREALGQAGLRAFQQEASFKPTADAALAGYQLLHDDLERQVKRGDLTMKVAREKAAASAAVLRNTLSTQAASFSPVPRAFLDKLMEAGNIRRRSREHMSLEGLQRETNRLLRLSLIEQQMETRIREFEGRTFVRTLPGGQQAPTLDSVLAFHESATHAGDDSAREWGRRQLEAMRVRVTDTDDLRRIDLACDRPEAVNPRIVASYIEAVQDEGPAELEEFTRQALDSHDANACMASFLMARGVHGGSAVRWVRLVLDNLHCFPDVALETLRSLEADARSTESQSAQAHADYAIAVAEAQARFPGLEPPSDDDLARHERLRAKPVARFGQPIGLALDRRGADPGDPIDLSADEEFDTNR